MNKKIAIIGMGHMGKALMEGLIAGGLKKENILVSNNSVDNKKIVLGADSILLAVKPALVSQVITEVKDFLANKIILSVAAGVSVTTLEKYTHHKQKIIRLMPNLPVAYGQGIIGIYANKNVSLEEEQNVRKLFSKLGTVLTCKKEEDLDALTIVAGSGPAIVSYCISLLAKSGQEFGLTEKTAEKISFQTFQGTVHLLNQTKQTAQVLQNAVATKGGATEQIIRSLDKEKISLRFLKSLASGYAKIKRIEKNLP